MPSPARTAISAFMSAGQGLARGRRFVAFDIAEVAAQVAEFVDAVQQTMPRECLQGEGDGHPGGQRQSSRCDVDVDEGAGMIQQPLRDGLVDHDGEQSVLQRIAAEDVRDFGADDGAKSEVEQRPGRVLARRPAAEVAAGDQHLRAACFGIVESKLRIWRAVCPVAPIGEQLRPQADLGGGGEKPGRNDLIRVDVARRDRHGLGMNASHRLHYSISRGSVMRPRTALAAAVYGLANRVLAPTPWRPSKFLLLVLTEYSPAATVSPFIPRHIEQPDSRQSAPAALNVSA